MWRVPHILVSAIVAAGLLVVCWCLVMVITTSFRFATGATVTALAGGVVGRAWKEHY